MSNDTCPQCGSNQQAGAISQESIDAGYYGEGVTHYSRTICVEIPGVYDGGLFWMCPDCGGAWHRHDPESRLGKKAQPFIDKYNNREYGAGL